LARAAVGSGGHPVVVTAAGAPRCHPAPCCCQAEKKKRRDREEEDGGER
jgi:hypothetical protein